MIFKITFGYFKKLVIIAILINYCLLINQLQSRTIIFINGTSSSGKTSIRNELISMLGPNWESVSIDKYVKNKFYEEYSKELDDYKNIDIHVNNFLSFEVANLFITVNIIGQIIQMINDVFKQGKDVVLDHILFGEEMQIFLEQFRDCNIIFALAYCPFETLNERVKSRNIDAKKTDATIDEKLEKRDLARAIR
ncbi:MAG: AAA family ATPase [bacterium]